MTNSEHTVTENPEAPIQLRSVGEIYAPLNPEEDEIRLLEINADDEASPTFALRSAISLRLHKPRYIALSYPWGDPAITKRSLNVGDHSISISQNLENALDALIKYWKSHYEDHNRQFLVWIDQICINQQDGEEKNHQVAYMREIYTGADEVAIWLPMRAKLTLHGPASSLNLESGSLFQYDAYLLHYSQDGMWDDISAILSSPWWSRVWVYQEFILASRATFLVRDHAIPWHRLYNVLDRVMPTARYIVEKEDLWREFARPRRVPSESTSTDHHSEDTETSGWKGFWDFVFCRRDATDATDATDSSDATSDASDAPNTPDALDVSELSEPERLALQTEFRRFVQAAEHRNTALARWPIVRYVMQEKSQSIQAKGSIALPRLLSHTQKCECTDPRDRVFAVLGLADASYGLVADYGSVNTKEEVSLATTIACLKKERSLSVVMRFFKDKQITPTGVSHVPGWMPDLCEPFSSNHSYEQFLNSLALPKNCQASGKAKTTVSILPDRSGEPNKILKVRGRRIASLSRMLRDDPQSQVSQFDDTAKSGLMYKTRSNARSGDEVWVLLGSETPVTLHPMKEPQHYIIIGHTLVCEDWTWNKPSQIMFGSIMDESNIAEEDVMIL